MRFWGTRGLFVAPGEAFSRYGGATMCLEVGNDAGSRLIVDLGTGSIPLGHALQAGTERRLGVILSSTRVDHIQGLPFFLPALIPGWDLTILGPARSGRDISGILDGSLNPNYSPLYGVQNLTPKLDLTTLTEGELSWGGFRIITRELPHGPDPSLGLRIESDGRVLAVIADVQYEGEPAAAAFDLASGADVLVHDTSESPLGFMGRTGGAPSASPDALAGLQVAREAEARALVLYRHDPDRSDAQIDALLADLRRRAGPIRVDAARADEIRSVGS